MATPESTGSIDNQLREELIGQLSLIACLLLDVRRALVTSRHGREIWIASVEKAGALSDEAIERLGGGRVLGGREDWERHEASE